MSKNQKETIYTEVGLTGHEQHSYIVTKYNQNQASIQKDEVKKFIFEEILLKPEARREYDVANGITLEKLDMHKAQNHKGLDDNPVFKKAQERRAALEAREALSPVSVAGASRSVSPQGRGGR